MMRQSNQLLARATLLAEAWNYKFVPTTNLVDVHMGRLRQKVDASNEIPMIHGVRGAGFIQRMPTSTSFLQGTCGQGSYDESLQRNIGSELNSLWRVGRRSSTSVARTHIDLANDVHACLHLLGGPSKTTRKSPAARRDALVGGRSRQHRDRPFRESRRLHRRLGLSRCPRVLPRIPDEANAKGTSIYCNLGSMLFCLC
jgi:hypothetical protein